MTPEWSRPERLDAIGEREKPVHIEADAAERAGLARRFGLKAVDRLSADLVVRRDAAGVVVTGRVQGDVVQACGVTDEPVPAVVDEAVELRFVEALDGEEEVELSVEAMDVVVIEGSAIDLGEAAAETMALALDPFPRSPNAAQALREAGVISEDEVQPMNAFAGLKDKLAGR
ncbi:DUF177 domain-containing protein [uncultured Sphingomonas sp.]|uniref:YceD family protein n=1 Tax=Sphingomonas sp. TaxID=28214 RepID=UPI00262E75C7|nr:DUF177 domain-containing protein [uncultured Sphingomonas sp.]